MMYSSVPVPEASLREALVELGGAMAEMVELGAVERVLVVAEVLKLLVEGRANERRRYRDVKIRGGRT